MKRQLAAILYADVAGYSKLSGIDEESTHVRLDAGLNLLTEHVESNEGIKVNEAGDAILAEFQSVISAVQAAIDFQIEMSDQNERLDDKNRFEFRIGVHLGEIIHNRGDIYGDGVNLAARIQGVAVPGGVTVSGAVHDQVKGNFKQSFHDLGYQKLKNIEGAVHIYSLDVSDLKGTPHPTSFLASRVKDQPLFDLDGTGLKQMSAVTGGCLCGKIRYESVEPAIGTGFCHCRICQRALGAPINAWVAFPSRSLHFSHGEPVYYQSSAIAKRGFCATCGTSLTYQMLKPSLSEYIVLCIPTLDRPEDYSPAWHGGIESQLPWLNLHDDLPRMKSLESPSLCNAWKSAGINDPDEWKPERSEQD